jgi:hypothetical protein
MLNVVMLDVGGHNNSNVKFSRKNSPISADVLSRIMFLNSQFERETCFILKYCLNYSLKYRHSRAQCCKKIYSCNLLLFVMN